MLNLTDRGGPARPPTPPPVPNPPPTQSYCNTLLKKYKFEHGLYRSTTTGSMFENMISYVPGGSCFDALKIWQTEKFKHVRAIDENIRQAYRKQSGGHGGYTFHSLTPDEFAIFERALFS